MYCLDNIDNIKNTVRPKKTAHVYVPYNCGRKCPFCESRWTSHWIRPSRCSAA